MQELRVQIEAVQTAEVDRLSAWFTLPIDEELFSERLGVDAESNDYRITEKELPFAEEVDEDTTVDRLNDFYYTYESLPADLKEDYGELMCHFTSLEELHQHRHDTIHYSWCKNMAAVELAGRGWKIGTVRALLHYQLCLDDKPLFKQCNGLCGAGSLQAGLHQ